MSEEKIRCSWCLKDDLYKDYHDDEWGKPSRDDRHLFEMLILETMQAGLSWHTILLKRENFREAFDGFEAEKIANYGERKFKDLMTNPGIIRNKLKIRSAINNAQRYLDLQAEYDGFHNYLWKFSEGRVIDKKPKTLSEVPATTPESDAMSKDMKKQGFKFVGSTTCYAYMQSVGIVNDHIESCWVREKKG